MSFADLGRVLVVIPTYNEAENLEPVLARLRAAVPEAHVLVVDDGSPDGTGEVADRLAAAADAGVHVLHRTAKAGLGTAYIAGFRWALGRRATTWWSRWTPTARTHRRSCPGCSPRCATPTW